MVLAVKMHSWTVLMHILHQHMILTCSQTCTVMICCVVYTAGSMKDVFCKGLLHMSTQTLTHIAALPFV